MKNHQNRILMRLPPAEFERLRPHLEHISLDFKEPLYEQGSPVTYVFFVKTGVISLVTELEQGKAIETGTIGREGMVGLPAFFGAPTAPWRAFCQIPGDAYRVSAAALRSELRNGGALGPLLMRYANAVMAMLAQSAACNGAHSVEERMCRWLLTTHDRVDSDDFALTQEFLGHMLGVRRPTVSLAGGVLQRAGLIKYSRGRITILDRAGLESASCECYAFVQKQFNEAFGEDTRRAGKG